MCINVNEVYSIYNVLLTFLNKDNLSFSIYLESLPLK